MALTSQASQPGGRAERVGPKRFTPAGEGGQAEVMANRVLTTRDESLVLGSSESDQELTTSRVPENVPVCF